MYLPSDICNDSLPCPANHPRPSSIARGNSDCDCDCTRGGARQLPPAGGSLDQATSMMFDAAVCLGPRRRVVIAASRVAPAVQQIPTTQISCSFSRSFFFFHISLMFFASLAGLVVLVVLASLRGCACVLHTMTRITCITCATY